MISEITQRRIGNALAWARQRRDREIHQSPSTRDYAAYGRRVSGVKTHDNHVKLNKNACLAWKNNPHGRGHNIISLPPHPPLRKSPLGTMKKSRKDAFKKSEWLTSHWNFMHIPCGNFFSKRGESHGCLDAATKNLRNR